MATFENKFERDERMAKVDGKIDMVEVKFLDVDENIEAALEHLAKHEKAYVRKSANNNLHAIVADGCEECDKLSDPKYNGHIFFSNKGRKWAEYKWKDAKIGERNLNINMVMAFPCVHFVFGILDVNTGKVKLKHGYAGTTDYSHIQEFLRNNEVQCVMFAFQIVVARKLEDVTCINDQESDDTKTFHGWVEDLDGREANPSYVDYKLVSNMMGEWLQYSVPAGHRVG